MTNDHRFIRGPQKLCAYRLSSNQLDLFVHRMGAPELMGRMMGSIEELRRFPQHRAMPNTNRACRYRHKTVTRDEILILLVYSIVDFLAPSQHSKHWVPANLTQICLGGPGSACNSCGPDWQRRNATSPKMLWLVSPLFPSCWGKLWTSVRHGLLKWLMLRLMVQAFGRIGPCNGPCSEDVNFNQVPTASCVT